MDKKVIKQIEKKLTTVNRMNDEFMRFMYFIALVRAGEKAIIFGDDYVVTNDATYREYCRKQKKPNLQKIFDEAAANLIKCYSKKPAPAPKKATRRKKP